jgi:hypothetical protein
MNKKGLIDLFISDIMVNPMGKNLNLSHYSHSIQMSYTLMLPNGHNVGEFIIRAEAMKVEDWYKGLTKRSNSKLAYDHVIELKASTGTFSFTKVKCAEMKITVNEFNKMAKVFRKQYDLCEKIKQENAGDNIHADLRVLQDTYELDIVSIPRTILTEKYKRPTLLAHPAGFWIDGGRRP